MPLTVEITQRTWRHVKKASSQINSYKRRYYYRVFALLFGFRTGIISASQCFFYELRKDIGHNASERSFTHCTKISISYLKWVISWNLDGLENARHSAYPWSESDVSKNLWYVRCSARVRKNHCLICHVRRIKGRQELWYLTARGWSLISHISSRSLFLFTRKLKFRCVLFVCLRMFKSTRRKDL